MNSSDFNGCFYCVLKVCDLDCVGLAFFKLVYDLFSQCLLRNAFGVFLSEACR